jgi:hypothetical protein
VNLRVAVETEPASPQNVAPGTLESDVHPGFIESWLHDHINAIAVTVVAAGFSVRIFVASRSYLNPDEALHYLLIHHSSVVLAYKDSLSNAHPPLLFIILYFWQFLGRSELMLRLPSALAGTTLCWAAFKWIGDLFGRTAALIGLIFVAFSPAMIALSAEVRDYALLLFCMVTALYFLGRAFQEHSMQSMCYFSIFLYLAILSHYSAIFFAMAIGLYSLVRISDAQRPRKLVAAWAIGQAGALAIYGFLYVTQLSKITNNIAGWGKTYDQYYFHSGYADLFSFLQENTSNIFLYIFEQEYVSETVLVLFVVGVAVLFFRGLLPARRNPRSCHLGILLLLPFIAVWGAAVFGIYPYVGSRHTVFLAPFAIAAASFLLAAVCGQKLWAGLSIATLLMGMSNAYGKPSGQFITKENQDRSLMIAAMNHIQQTVPRTEMILVDYQSGLPIAYYLCGPRNTIRLDALYDQLSKSTCNGYSIISLDSHLWKLTPGNFPPKFQQLAYTYGLKPGDRVWVFQAGWGANLDTELPAHVPKFRCLASKSFGANITVIPFVVGSDLLPTKSITSC